MNVLPRRLLLLVINKTAKFHNQSFLLLLSRPANLDDVHTIYTQAGLIPFRVTSLYGYLKQGIEIMQRKFKAK